MRIALIFLALISSFYSFSQGQWVWLNGDSATSSPAVYGVKNVPSPINYPKAGYAGAEWADTSGNFWYYNSQSGLADMWKYIPANNTWTWETGTGLPGTVPVYGTKGVPSILNTPGRVTTNNSGTWTDKFNYLWLYNGQMWRFNPATLEWTFMQGTAGVTTPNYGTKNVPAPTNNPGIRTENTCTWVDKNDIFWFFGGGNSGYKNDLWKYDYTTNQWTWVNGSSGSNVASVNGTKGVPAVTNNPGGRYVYSNWYDAASHSLYFFGGYQSGSSKADLWKYDIATDIWTWVSGSTVIKDVGNYGTQCDLNTNNYPPSRFENKIDWQDDCGNFWMFGGFSQATVGGPGHHNDLWKYKPSTNEWAWISGVQGRNSVYNYGQKGVPSGANIPPSAFGQSGAHGKQGFFLYGSPNKYSSAVWQYVPDPPVAYYTYSPTLNCRQYQFTDSSYTGCNEIKEYLWDFGDGDTSTTQHPIHQYAADGIYNVSLIVTNCTWQKDTLTLAINVSTVPINAFDTIQICFGDSIFLQNAYQSSSGDFYDTLATSNGCDSIVATNLTVNPIATGNTNTQICQGDSILLGGIYQNTSGVYNDTIVNGAANGCDSVVVTTLTVNQFVTGNANVQICQGDSILLGGAYQTAAGNYKDTIVGGSASGCDSIVTTNLIVNPVSVNNVNASICQNDSIFLEGAYQNTSGVYNDVIVNGAANGCDSIITTNLSVIPISVGNANARVCDGDSILIGSNYYSTAGVYPYTIPNGSASGCDSIVNVNLAIDYAFSNHQDFTICQGDSILLGGKYVSKFGYNEVKYQSINGCDSTYTATISFVPQYDFYLPEDTTLCIGQKLIINPIINSNYYNMMWENGSTSTYREVDTSGTYIMTYSHKSCNHQGNDEINVLFENCDFFIYVPNTFTPDKDGLNDGFAPVIYGDFTDYSFRIFDRWGEVIFESTTHGESWKGTYMNELVKTDVYVWKLIVKPKKDKEITQTGKVTILK